MKKTLVIILALMFIPNVFVAQSADEKSEKKETVNMALTNVASEMSINHTRIESAYDYYIRVIKQIDSIKTNHPEKFDKLYGYNIKGWQGIQPTMLRSSAYQTLLNSGVIKDIPFEILKSLDFIYHVQSVIEQINKSLIDEAVTDRGFTSLNKVHHIFILYTDILPDVMAGYQHHGKKYLESYGYSNILKDERLKRW